jgi:hypothetical protein
MAWHRLLSRHLVGFQLRIFGLVGGEMHGPLGMFVFSYGLL